MVTTCTALIGEWCVWFQFERLTLFEPHTLPPGYELNMVDMMIHIKKMMENVENMLAKETFPIFPDIPGFNMTEMEMISTQLMNNIKTMDANTLTK